VKILNSHTLSSGRNATLGTWALTLVEMMITMGVFSMVMMALLYVHMFGLRQDELVESKLGASDAARRDFEQMLRDVRGAQAFEIGNYASGAFSAVPYGTIQTGNALRLGLSATVYPGTNILYYFNTNTPGNFTLNRFHTGDIATKTIASSLTNWGGGLLFNSEDYAGQPVSDQLDRRVVHCTIAFAQYQYPLTKVGSNYLYDYYKMEFRVTPHVPPGR